MPPHVLSMPAVCKMRRPAYFETMIQKDYSIKPLAAAVVIQALKDARAGDPGAREWLQHDGLVFLDVCGVTLERVQMQRWIKRGCKMRNTGGMRLGA